jgi:hypothetical protein
MSGQPVALSPCRAGKICKIVSGCKCVALGGKQYDANNLIFLSCVQGFGCGAIHRV